MNAVAELPLRTDAPKPSPTGLALLREPFPSNLVSLLPKPLLKREEMDKLPKASCRTCGGYHATSKVIHLEYVGHAALTHRLLDADPNWTWEPVATDDLGLPKLSTDGLLWIRLTVCGVTRLGVGDSGQKQGGNAAGDAMKERIGDALRNAAMRFGAGLEMWHKGDLEAIEDDDDPRAGGAAATSRPGVASDAALLRKPPEPPATAAETPFYPADRFEANIDGWRGLIHSGRKTADAIIKQVHSGGYLLTEDQQAAIRGKAAA